MFHLNKSLFRIIKSTNLRNAQLPKAITTTYFCTSTNSSNENKSKKKIEKEKLPAIRNAFESVSNKTKDTYLDMVTIFEGRDVHRRNHVEFIYAALRNMETFGVHCDLEVYKALINVMPKGKFIPTNIIQAEFMHYPKQQQCIIDLLEQMEDNGVIPDTEMEQMLLNIFGKRGHPLRKYWRMMYWMPKFKNLSPWPLPNPVPNENFELAKLAVERMCTVDLLSKIEIYDTADVDESIDKTWIVSGMSPEQSQLLIEHNKTKPLYIEGPFYIWLRNKMINYFTLRGDPEHTEVVENDDEDDPDDVRQIRIPFFGRPSIKESRIAKKRSVHQQNDGIIYAICATGTSSQDSLLSWIRIIEKNGNSCLSNIPILFKLKLSKASEIVPVQKDTNIKDDKTYK